MPRRFGRSYVHQRFARGRPFVSRQLQRSFLHIVRPPVVPIRHGHVEFGQSLVGFGGNLGTVGRGVVAIAIVGAVVFPTSY